MTTLAEIKKKYEDMATHESINSREVWADIKFLLGKVESLGAALKWFFSKELTSRFSPVDIGLLREIDDPDYGFTDEEKAHAKVILETLTAGKE